MTQYNGGMEMNRNVNNILVFTIGAAVGAGITWKLLKTKYENIANEEINEIRELYASKQVAVEEPANEEVEEKEEGPSDNRNVRDYNDIIKKEGYVDYSEVKKEEKGEVEVIGPVVVSEDEFCENPEYDSDTFIYYSDAVLADHNGNVINTANTIVGSDYIYALESESVVYVRNDELEMYYEIVKDEGEYADLFPQNSK